MMKMNMNNDLSTLPLGQYNYFLTVTISYLKYFCLSMTHTVVMKTISMTHTVVMKIIIDKIYFFLLHASAFFYCDT